MTGRKHHIVVDIRNNFLTVVVQAANIGDRDDAWDVLDRLTRRCPTIAKLWVDDGYTGAISVIAEVYGVTLATVSKQPDQHTFVVLPRRWVVERPLAWTGRSRILSKEYTRCKEDTESWIYLSMIQQMVNTLRPNDTRTTRYENQKMARKTA